MKAYVFVTADGEATDLAAALRLVPGVTEADETTGEIAVITACEADDPLELNKIVGLIRQQTGVLGTSTRVVISRAPAAVTQAAIAA